MGTSVSRHHVASPASSPASTAINIFYGCCKRGNVRFCHHAASPSCLLPSIDFLDVASMGTPVFPSRGSPRHQYNSSVLQAWECLFSSHHAASPHSPAMSILIKMLLGDASVGNFHPHLSRGFPAPLALTPIRRACCVAPVGMIISICREREGARHIPLVPLPRVFRSHTINYIINIKSIG